MFYRPVQQKFSAQSRFQLTVLANMGKVQFANLDSAVQEFAKINTALRELQEGGVAKSQSSIQNRENHRRNFKPCIGGR